MFRRYWSERKYVNGKPTDEYRQTEMPYNDMDYDSYEECMFPDSPVPPADPNDYYNQYFTIDVSTNTTIYLASYVPKDELYYSINYGRWTKYNGGFTVKTGDKVCFKNTSDKAYYFNSTGTIESVIRNLPATRIYGNLNSMYAGDNFVDDIRMYSYAYQYWFGGTSIVNVSNLVLPARRLAPSCYYGMFSNCKYLKKTPELTATRLADSCYHSMFVYCTSLTETSKLPATTVDYSSYEEMFRGCTALVNAPELPATTVDDRGYYLMFRDCTSLTKAPELPAMELGRECYWDIFYGCTALVNAPKLPAIKLAESCYSGMFSGCTSLVKAPDLPATTLARFCYGSMFSSCTALTEVPEILPATTLAEECYSTMFYGCSKLTRAPELPAKDLVKKCYFQMLWATPLITYIKCLAENGINANDSTKDWKSAGYISGTFVKKKGITWPSGNNGIPEGWTVEEVD